MHPIIRLEGTVNQIQILKIQYYLNQCIKYKCSSQQPQKVHLNTVSWVLSFIISITAKYYPVLTLAYGSMDLISVPTCQGCHLFLFFGGFLYVYAHNLFHLKFSKKQPRRKKHWPTVSLTDSSNLATEHPMVSALLWAAHPLGVKERK